MSNYVFRLQQFTFFSVLNVLANKTRNGYAFSALKLNYLCG